MTTAKDVEAAPLEQKEKMLLRPPSDPSVIDKNNTSNNTPPIRTQVVTLSHKSRSCGAKTKRFLKGRLQILNWIGDYNTEWGINDLIAGITLGLTIIPESIACALLAGLSARYGLCSAFIGSFVYLFFGSINKVIIGPTSLVALVTVQFTMGKPIEFAFLLTLLSGVVQLIMGSLRMGKYIVQCSVGTDIR